jgi:hypothetical protein
MIRARPALSILVLFSTLSLAPLRTASGNGFGSRPDAHAPIGVMVDHTHAKGGWMLSYRFEYMSMKGMRDRTVDLSAAEVFASPYNYSITPTSMDMYMHMFGLMWAPADLVTLNIMVPFLQKDMNHRIGAGATDGQRFTTRSSNVGDVKLWGLFNVWKNEHNKVIFNAGLSLPTGSINEQDTVLTPMNTQPLVQLPYPMQNSSGTFDLMPGATYTGHTDAFSWGVQAIGTVRTGLNDNGWRPGNRVDATVWTAYPFADWISGSVRFAWMWQDNVIGADPSLNPAVVPTADPTNQGLHRLDFLLGLNLIVPLGALGKNRLAVEAGLPAYQWLYGPQLATGWRITVGWQKAFDGLRFWESTPHAEGDHAH